MSTRYIISCCGGRPRGGTATVAERPGEIRKHEIWANPDNNVLPPRPPFIIDSDLCLLLAEHIVPVHLQDLFSWL